MHHTRIHNRWPIAREGLPFVVLSWGLAFIVLYFGLTLLFIFLGLLALFVTWFFRDPDRGCEIPGKAVLAPADGKIIEVVEVESGLGGGETAVKISIFMSVFNVHVNRIPVNGKVLEIAYSPGKFFSASLDKASKYNERNLIVLETPTGERIGLIQIAGLIARRIACWISEGDQVEAGQRFGLIRFGSRAEIFLPPGSSTPVSPGQKVRAGETVIGYLQ